MKTQTTTIENWQNYNIGQVHNDNSSRKKFSWKVKVKAPKIIKTKPFVKWAGGKRQIMSLILKNLPPKFNNYFEPFVGGGSVFLELKNEGKIKYKSYINDINFELIETYKCIRSKSCKKELFKHLATHKKNNTKEWFLKIRKWDQDKNYLSKHTRAQRASRLIYMNRVCFNGLYRVNSKNYFNVPYGRYVNPKILDENNLNSFQKKLSKVHINNLDFEKVLKKAKKGDFVYIDPPYMPTESSKNIFNSYSQFKFCVDEQIRLRNTMDKLTKKGVKVLLSNSYCKWIMGKYSHYTIIKIKVNRPINSNGSKRRVSDYNEVLIKNY